MNRRTCPFPAVGVVFPYQDHDAAPETGKPEAKPLSGQPHFPPNAVKKIITKPTPNSPSATNTLHTTLYHCFPTTDQLI